MHALSYVNTHSLSRISWQRVTNRESAWVHLRYECVLKRVYVIPLCLRRGQESCLVGAHGPSSMSSVTGSEDFMAHERECARVFVCVSEREREIERD